VVEVGALVGLSSVVLVMIIGQPRIFMIMGRDGLLPPVFTKIHPKYRTPHINTVITGIGIALLAALFALDILGELTSMGTLIAFAAVCAGVLILRRTQPDLPRPFRMPMAWLICSLGVLSCLALLSAMTMHNWMLMGVWTFVGFVIYFCYGFRHSRLRESVRFLFAGPAACPRLKPEQRQERVCWLAGRHGYAGTPRAHASPPPDGLPACR
jgi:APA family basic amino acid/polyamine antiporter